MTFTFTGHVPHPLNTTEFFVDQLRDAADGGTDYNFVELFTQWLDNHGLKSQTGGVPVTITEDNSFVTTGDVATALAYAFHPEATHEDSVKANSILADITGSISKAHNLSIDKAWVSQALTQLHLPAPVPNKVMYYAHTDVIPAAKGYKSCRDNPNPTNLTKGNEHLKEFFVSLAATYNTPTLGVAMADGDTFAEFIEHFREIYDNLKSQGLIDTNTDSIAHDFMSLGLEGLTESLLLREEYEATNSYSFPRILIHALNSFIVDSTRHAHTLDKPAPCAYMPFSFSEFLSPRAIVFANIKSHALANPRDITNRWESINQALQEDFSVLSLDQITKLDSAINQRNKAELQAQRSRQSLAKVRRDVTQGDVLDSPPKTIDLTAEIKSISQKIGQVNKSMNVQKFSRKSLTKQSRRRPHDLNAPGRRQSKIFYPDYHFYPDCSGSISQDEYITSMISACLMAKKLGVDVYYNSFSHFIGQEIKIPVHRLSVQELIAFVYKLPAVSGGTDFSAVWDYINQSPGRSQQLSLMFTDFGYLPYHSDNINHPRNLFYIPTIPTNDSWNGWNDIKNMAMQFANEMKVHEPHITGHMLGMWKR